jgi:sarcosine oxidase subunit beta
MSADVVIVGAGVIGAATAFHLARLGGASVEILESATVGSGMSARSSALVRMHYSFGPEVELALRSDEMFDAWPDLVGRPHCISRTGFVRIVGPGEEDNLTANVSMQRALGATVELIGPSELSELAPGLVTGDVVAAAYEPRGGYGDGSVVAGDLLEAARRRGVRYLPETAVHEIVIEAGRVVGVLATDGIHRGATTVVATGVWAPRLLGPVSAVTGVELPLETELHHVAHLNHPRGQGASLACIDSVTETYFRPEASGERTLVGSFTGVRGVDPHALPPSVEADQLAGLVERVLRRIPGLADAGIGRGTTGLYDMTPDARPLLGEVAGLPGVVIAVGFSGMGFKIAPAVGESLACLVAGSATPGVSLAPFRPSRFAEEQPIRPPHAYADD